MPLRKSTMASAVAALLLCAAAGARADEGVHYQTETLDNGLRVIYAPMPNCPVAHIRVLYHVGSHNEQPDRQGFAHMFEHMMFRGSEHVKPQEHMKLVGLVGGFSNAFTSFDQTVYHDTLPASYTNLALWLEADRMSSFKVSADIFSTERKVVSEEWRMRQNQPYGTMFEDLCAEVYKTSPYRWTPIGNMDDLQAAKTPELQSFFNKYYIPGNAILVIAGGIDVAKVKGEVHRYFSWIPKGDPLKRDIPQEPAQTQARREQVRMRVPLPRVVIAYPMPPIATDDQDALQLMLSVLGDGRSSRLSRALVTSDDPMCLQADEIAEPLEDGGLMGVEATLQRGKDIGAVEKILREQIAAMANAPVSAEELEKAKQQERLDLAQRWKTAESTADQLGETMLMWGSLDRVKTERARMEALTPADLQRVAAKYFADAKSNTLIITPGKPTPPPDTGGAIVPGAAPQPVATAAPRAVHFPADYPTKPPISGMIPHAVFDKGVETMIDGVQVIVMEDHRIPMVNWSLTTRMGSYAEPKGKEGVADLTAGMVRRGPAGKTYDAFNEELDAHGVSLNVSDGGDTTTVAGSCLTEQLPFALDETRAILAKPAFDPAEFSRLKAQSLDDLQLEMNTPAILAARQLSLALYGDGPIAHLTDAARGTIDSLETRATLNAITLDDVKKFHDAVYSTKGAVLMINGDITAADGQKAAEKLLADLPAGDLPAVDYAHARPAAKKRIVLVDFPPSKQAIIRLGLPAYTLRNDEKFAGSLAGQLLSNGIDSRLGRYVRAEKGYVYGVDAVFEPGREAGMFDGDTGTRFETTGATIEAMYKVFDDMKGTPVPEQELKDAQSRVAGSIVMGMQTIGQQAARRVAAILNGYPIDYYDVYPERISQVTAEQVKDVMNKYVDESHMTIVVVAPAKAVKAQLEKLGAVVVTPAGE